MAADGSPASARPAADRWAAELAAWAIDPEILAAAPESPYVLPPALFTAHHRPPKASTLIGLVQEALPEGGTLLDVGAGGGAASLPALSPQQRLYAVDTSPDMLAKLREEAAARGIPLTTFEGKWPDVAPDVPTCDVVVCANVAYNVADLAAFATALTGHARRRVVMELHAAHPWVPMGPLWQHFHHQQRPDGPSAELAVEVLREAGIDPQVHRFTEPVHDIEDELWPEYVAFARRRLCLTPDRDDEVAALLRGTPVQPRESVGLVWSPGA